VHASQRPVDRHIHSRDGRLIEQNCGDTRTQNGVIGITDVQAHDSDQIEWARFGSFLCRARRERSTPAGRGDKARQCRDGPPECWRAGASSSAGFMRSPARRCGRPAPLLSFARREPATHQVSISRASRSPRPAGDEGAKTAFTRASLRYRIRLLRSCYPLKLRALSVPCSSPPFGDGVPGRSVHDYEVPRGRARFHDNGRKKCRMM
jgi:hypothetical protein